MPNFKKYNYNQDAMVVINFEEQLQPDTFEFTLHHLIDNHIDLSCFYDKYKNDGGGRSAYDPTILLKIILFAYSKGITSSREIQWQCEHNIIFKALSCDTVPHFTGIASFVSSNPDAIESVFEQVLMVCDQQGLLGNELFAIDGCKMPSNAAKEHSGTLKELKDKSKKIRRQIRYCLKEHKKLDGRKPQDRERKQRLAQSAETLEKHFSKIDKFLKTASPRMGMGKKPKEVKSNITDNESAKMTTSKGTIQGYNGIAAVDKKHQIIVEAQTFGASQEHHTLKPMLDGINLRYKRTGIHADILKSQAIVTADTGFANEPNYQYLKEAGINAYVPDNQFRSRDPKFKQQKEKYGKRHQYNAKGQLKVIPASEFSVNIKKKTAQCPAGKTLWLSGERPTNSGKVRLFFEGNLTDCRHCDLKKACMRNPESADTREGHGRQVSIAVSTGKSATDWMKRRVDSKLGKQIYSHRMSVVEPVFGNIGTNKRLNRFSLRGKEKVQGQWRLFCLVHNIEKVMRYGELAS
jgi:transposase